MLSQKSIPIPVEIADVEIAKFITLKEEGAKVLVEKFMDEPEKVEFHGSKHNSFVFERKDILRFFLDEKDITEKAPEGKAELLMVIFGAHPGVDAIELEEYKPHEAQFPQGKPTVIVAGANFNPEAPEEEQLTLLKTAKPASEYPPGRTVTKLVVEEGTSNKQLFMRFSLD